MLWPRYEDPADLTGIEAVPLGQRGLPDSTYALLARAARRWPHHPALKVMADADHWQDPWRCTYAQLLAAVHRSANLLYSLGVRRTDAVALIAPNSAELIVATLAAQLAGIAAPINGSLSRHHIEELLRRSGARVLIAGGPALSDDNWRTAIDLVRDGVVDTVLALRHTEDDVPLSPPAAAGTRIGYLHELAAACEAGYFVGTPPADSDLAALLHTGGTTGVPKLAAHRHCGQVANAWMIAASPLFDGDATLFSALPLFHANALIVSVLAPLFKGRPVLWAGPLGYRDPALYPHFWRILAHHRITMMSAVPTVYAALADHPVDADISHLRYGIVGASPLPQAVRERVERDIGIVLVEGYGLTEATCASALNLPADPRPGTVGQRMPYQQAKVVRVHDDGRWTELPTGAVGVLALSGPTVFPGYVVGRTDTSYRLDGLGSLADGWLDTGDLAHLDADGFIHLHGRAKDLIIRGGHNIDPAVIEEALLSCPEVASAAAVGRPDAHAGEVPVAYVTLAPGTRRTAGEILTWAAQRVPEPVAAPKTVTVLDELPLTAVGKPYKPALRADATRRAVEDALSGVAGVHAVDTTVEDGTIVTTVALQPGADDRAVEAALNRFAVQWKTIHVPSAGKTTSE